MASNQTRLRKRKNIKKKTYKHHLLDDERARRARDDVDEVEIAVSDFSDVQVIELLPQLRGEGGRVLDVLYQGLLVQRPELHESYDGSGVPPAGTRAAVLKGSELGLGLIHEVHTMKEDRKKVKVSNWMGWLSEPSLLLGREGMNDFRVDPFL
ncbi:hypothetical protein EUGRSUZ_I01101 [Eucalyptus grandis]|uniref:Uncharacterized protein n=2 Tax=Eucalyptus grandis TaxID=71139 RepID=A0ACC3JEL6_EUCGR|nr:hypothetical protein EUGRSUZ_I01101 [Eucalyptus grandis]